MRKPPTIAGPPVTPQGSGRVIAGVLRACGWQPAGRAGAKILILSPAESEHRVVIRGCVLEVQQRQSDRFAGEPSWRTLRKMGALVALWSVVMAGDALVLFMPEETA